MFVDYQYYIHHFPQSAVKLEEFTLLAKKATREIENAVTGTIDVTDDVKMCCCELINYEAEAESNNAQSTNINSESVGDYSVSYASAAERRQNSKTAKADIIRFWLGKQGLNYRGVSRRVL